MKDELSRIVCRAKRGTDQKQVEEILLSAQIPFKVIEVEGGEGLDRKCPIRTLTSQKKLAEARVSLAKKELQRFRAVFKSCIFLNFFMSMVLMYLFDTFQGESIFIYPLMSVFISIFTTPLVFYFFSIKRRFMTQRFLKIDKKVYRIFFPKSTGINQSRSGYIPPGSGGGLF